MNIKIKCPVCNVNNILTPASLQCRRCQEDLSLLYITKGYSLKYRLQLATTLQQPTDAGIKQSLAHAAVFFNEPKGKA